MYILTCKYKYVHIYEYYVQLYIVYILCTDTFVYTLHTYTQYGPKVLGLTFLNFTRKVITRTLSKTNKRNSVCERMLVDST